MLTGNLRHWEWCSIFSTANWLYLLYVGMYIGFAELTYVFPSSGSLEFLPVHLTIAMAVKRVEVALHQRAAQGCLRGAGGRQRDGPNMREKLDREVNRRDSDTLYSVLHTLQDARGKQHPSANISMQSDWAFTAPLESSLDAPPPRGSNFQAQSLEFKKQHRGLRSHPF